jgi:integrase
LKPVLQYPPQYLTADEVAALMNACRNDPYGMRLRACIALLYRTGILAGELLDLKLADLDRTDWTIRVGGGRLAVRTLALDERAVDIVKAWLRHRDGIGGKHVICSPQGSSAGNKFNADQLRSELRDVLAPRAGLAPDTRVHPQGLRFSFAAELVTEGWPLPHIQAQLGITNLYSMDTLLRHLQIRTPDEEQLAAIVRTRVWEV